MTNIKCDHEVVLGFGRVIHDERFLLFLVTNCQKVVKDKWKLSIMIIQQGLRGRILMWARGWLYLNTTLKFNFTLLWCRTFCCEFHIVYIGTLSWSYFSFMLLRIGWSILEKYLPQQKDLIPKNLAMPFLKGRDAAVIRSREVGSKLKENLSSEFNQNKKIQFPKTNFKLLIASTHAQRVEIGRKPGLQKQ